MKFGDNETQPKALTARGDPSSYEIGYGKPPAATRFKSGKSGNPRGRPKGSNSAKALLSLALSAPISIVEGGAQKVIEQRFALFKALVAKAIKGDVRAAALVVKLMDQFRLDEPPQQQMNRIQLVAVYPEKRDGD